MEFLHNRSLLLLRLSLGVTFVWIGILKLFNASPVQDSISNAFPNRLGESQLFIFLLAIIDIAIGASFLTNRVVKVAATVMVVYVLVISVITFVTVGFDPRFPVLSLIGESVLKNLVIISAGLVLISDTSRNSVHGKTETQKPLLEKAS